MKTENIIVQSFRDCWDVEAKAEIHNIAKRGWCLFGCQMIHASLSWEKPPYSINLENHSADMGSCVWGTGYGGIEFCQRCKQIGCIHLWDWTKSYVIQHSPYYETQRTVSFCRICKRRVATSGGSSCHSKPEAWTLINAVADRLGRQLLMTGSYGSGWLLHLPAMVSEIMDGQGNEEAIRFVEDCFQSHSCEAAMRFMMARGN